MSLRELRRLATGKPVEARVISDGCRDYLIELVTDRDTQLLRDSRGRSQRFQNLGDVQNILRRWGVERAVLRHRVAQDEAAAPVLRESYHDQPLPIAAD